VSFSDELCQDAEAQRSEFWNEWVLPQGQGHALLGTIFNRDSLTGNIGAIRARGARPFALQDKRLVAELMPHLQRAVQLRGRISQLQTLHRTTPDALDHWTTAVFLLDCNARIVAANKAAADLTKLREGLFVERGALRAASASDSTLLRRFICASAGRTVNGDGNGAMLIERPSGKRPLHLLVTPSVSTAEFFGSAGRALVFVSDPEAAHNCAEILHKLYHLTPAEANVAELLASGKSVKEIADDTSVRENTFRIHLKKIFDKTGTKRQAELVKVILSSAGVRRD